MSRGESETKKLKSQLQSQLERLLDQLQDLENSKDELDEEEYSDMREDTLEQVEEFQASLTKLSSGDLGLVDSISAMQLAIQGAISQARTFFNGRHFFVVQNYILFDFEQL